MRKLWVLCLLVLLWPAQAAATEEKKDWMKDVFGCDASPCTISMSKGGITTRFKYAATQAKETHTQVKIDGECSSSCVIFASRAREQVCLTENAKIGIHKGFTFTLYDKAGNEVLVDITTGKNVDLFEFPPEGYRRVGQFVDLDYGKDINRWAKEFGKMPESDEVYPLTRDEAMLFWKPCE